MGSIGVRNDCNDVIVVESIIIKLLLLDIVVSDCTWLSAVGSVAIMLLLCMYAGSVLVGLEDSLL
mgnify:CR=1 FL=1